MKEVALVIWLIGFPLSEDLSRYVSFKIGEKRENLNDNQGMGLLFFWFLVAFIIIYI